MSEYLTVLIVDDDPDDREMFCEAVSEINDRHRCLAASNGNEALHMLQNVDTLPHFIFLDLNMPKMNGKQCLVYLKRDDRFSQIPVIIYSTSSLETDIEETNQLGADYYLRKPSSVEQLKKELRLVFDRKYENATSNRTTGFMTANN